MPVLGLYPYLFVPSSSSIPPTGSVVVLSGWHVLTNIGGLKETHTNEPQCGCETISHPYRVFLRILLLTLLDFSREGAESEFNS